MKENKRKNYNWDKFSYDKDWRGNQLSGIIMFIVYLLVGGLIIKVGVDNSKGTQYSKEILKELREIKELMMKDKNE
ncbi:DUF5453 family protein [Paenibacillus sp. J45TS6]|uniref:DUF5453 family protein n=1 Tax=Paenibacillus sp. J45TS6 TaxID=2807196 RepID=UPI001BCF6CE5|nr:DUF5453 family protein [Paenibacillus sp. J45TS6]